MSKEEEGEIWHLLPEGDVKKHEESENCSCKPRIVDVEDGVTMIIHNAFDCREVYEQAEERIKQDLN